MENLMAQSISKLPITIPTKQDATWDFSNRPNVASVPFSRKRHQVVTDSYVNYLCKTGRLSEAVAALDSLAQHGSEVRPDTFLNLVQSCIDSNSLILGRKVHSRIGLVKHKSPFLGTKLVSMYAKCGNLEDARKVFSEMGERNLFTWSAMIGACSRERRYREVIELFYMMMSMEDSCLPDAFLLPKILQACGNCGDLKTGKLIHLLVVKCGMGDIPRVSNSILAVYAKCGKLDVAERYFERMEQKDTAAWNAMMSGYCQIGDVEKAHRLFDAMCEEGTDPGLVSWNLLISGYNQIGRCDVAMELKKKMESNGIALDVVAWTSMISGFGQNNRTNQALDLFREMILTGVEPNGVTIASVVSACASLKSLNAGMEIHSLAVKLGNIHDVLVGNSLIDLYSKCGDLEAARQVYDLMAEKDVFSWNSMIGGYCQAGYCGKAYLLFTQLQNSNIQPNVITWNTMIWGYLQNGDEDQAMDLFQKMEKEGNIKRDTASWNSLIAGHIHIGQKDLALSIFRQMQSAGIRPNPVTILSVLPACASLIALNQVKEIHGCALRRNLVSALPVVNSLIDTYTKSGNIAYSRRLFDRIISKDVITFNSMIAGYILYACPDAALDIFDQMRISGIKPSRTTFASIILAQSLSSEKGEKVPVSAGPWGGQDGFRWDDGVYSTVRQFVIAHGAGIDSIQIEYDKKGVSIWSEKHGGFGGNRIDKVKLDYPNEFLTSVSGHYGNINDWGPVLIRSLTFESNKRTYGPFGVTQGTCFSLPVTGGRVVGFHGKSDWCLNAIGIYLKPHQQEKSSKAIVKTKSYNTNGSDSVGYSVIQGSAGNAYDIVVAVRQKDDNGNLLPKKLSTQISQDHYTDAGTITKGASIGRIPSKIEGLITYGPWGGTGGSLFDDGQYSGIRQIHLSRSIGIAYIRIQYDDNGQPKWGSKHGGNGGFKTDKIIFDYPSEILMNIRGTYWPLMYMGPHIIKSLTFYTNKGVHGPFGEEQGPSFTTKMKEGRIVGFHGREGLFLDAIGVHLVEGIVKPAKHYLSDAITKTEADVAEIDNSPWSNKLVVAKRGQTENVACGVIKEPAPCGPGPWGGDGGRPWDDGVFSGIKQIVVTRTAEAICSIQIEYDRNGQSVWSVKHGSTGGTSTQRVKLEYPHEVLTCMSGYYGAINREDRPKVVRSLTFYGSRGKYGPFGEETGTFFTSTTTEGKVVGFHGRCGAYLDAIGVHMQHWLGNDRPSKPSLFKFFN
ncbi:hypothetical protein K2173_027906 [Erythroxylum novogranatense]|uniref:Jacalin-type lectin domain-containing protein n=1 Tax=Erythroxylum novogranatense TaxID=1862640 RepID=A0AAV8U3A4_9ROSI|nr:hypothetical protein K2173_027906 [Erythroxylum novogranatense]